MRKAPGAGGPQTVSTAVVKATRILEFLARREERAGVRKLARTLDIDKTTTLRIVRALEAGGFVQRADGGAEYSLGHKALQLGMAYLEGLDLRARALPAMKRLRDLTQESVGLNIRVGDWRTYVALVESPLELKVKPEVGRPYPLYSGAPGRLLLAHLPPTEIDAILSRVPLVKLTPHTVVDRERLQGLLEKTRRDGYALAVEETIPGVATIAAPIRDHGGAVVGALGILGPVSRFARRMPSCRKLLVQHANEMSSELGWQSMGVAEARPLRG